MTKNKGRGHLLKTAGLLKNSTLGWGGLDNPKKTDFFMDLMGWSHPIHICVFVQKKTRKSQKGEGGGLAKSIFFLNRKRYVGHF